jgi:hypothetical protein
MSTFERIYQTDPAREAGTQRENISTALSDQEYLLRLRRDQHALDIGQYDRKKIDVVIEQYLEEKYAKSTRKSTPRKPKKDHPKPDASAMESVQEKL